MKKMLTFVVAFIMGGLAVSPIHAKAAPADWTAVTSNVVVDGGFEGVTSESSAPWVFVTGAVDSEKPGTIAIVNDVYSGQSLTLSTSASSTDFPEIYQIITVKANTDYYFNFRLRNNLPMTNANLYFGFSTTVYEDGYDYVQQHKWIDTATNHNYDGTNQEFTLVTGKFNPGNRTSVRAFIRVGKMNVTIDDVIIRETLSIVPLNGENLLQYPGFEGTDNQNNTAWKYEGVEGRELFGYDDVRTTAVYTPGQRMQDKQIEGFKNLYFGVGAGGGETYPLIYQEVDVTPDTVYSFYVNLTGWGSLWGGWVGIRDADGNDVDDAWTYLDYGDISLARYLTVSVSANSGDNTKLYPYIKADIGPTSGEWGSGVQVDDTYFFVSSDVPTGKTNLITNPIFDEQWSDETHNWSGWQGTWVGSEWESYITAYDDINDGGQGYDGENVARIKHWNAPGTYFTQNVTLEAGKLYNLVSRVMNDYVEVWKQEVEGNEDSWFRDDYATFTSPFIVKVSKGSTVLLNQEYRLERDRAFLPLGGDFAVSEAGSYTISFGFDSRAAGNWAGAALLGSVSLYEVTQEEITPPNFENPEGYLFSSSADVLVGDTTITVGTEMTVATLYTHLQTVEGYTVKVVDAGNLEVSGEKYLTSTYKLQLLDDGSVLAKTYTISATEHEGGTEGPGTSDGPGTSNGPGTTGGCKQGSANNAGTSVLVLLTTVLFSLFIFRKKEL
ncbi:MAG: hypothetical protein LBM99_03045 [Bacillales bacterium]|jgi:hypothetical protein|nr:hypothetical protein [Bacillales bacterium]